MADFQVHRLIPALQAVFRWAASSFWLRSPQRRVGDLGGGTTAVADMIVARNFRSFEFYLAATAMYLLMALGFQAIFNVIDQWLFALEQAGVIPSSTSSANSGICSWRRAGRSSPPSRFFGVE